jgi:hypothetical protein
MAAKRRAKKLQQRLKLLQKLKKRKEKSLQMEQMKNMENDNITKYTHLSILKKIFNLDLTEIQSLKFIASNVFTHLGRVPNIFPKYNSQWMRMIARCASQKTDIYEIESIGYYKFLKLEDDINQEVNQHSYLVSGLEPEQEAVTKESFELTYKLCLDLDIENRMMPEIHNLSNKAKMNEIVPENVLEMPIESVKSLFQKFARKRSTDWECQVPLCSDSLIPDGFEFGYLEKLEEMKKDSLNKK